MFQRIDIFLISADRMSVMMTKGEGVTMITLNSDPSSSCPPICQILKGLCYSPALCSVSQPLKKKASLSILGAMQIMIGLLNIGTGSIFYRSEFSTVWYLNSTKFPFWSGTLFIAFGLLCILSERFPSRCLVVLNVIMSVAGVAFSITAIVLYSIQIANYRPRGCNFWYYGYETPTQEMKTLLQKKWNEIQQLTLVLLRGLNGVLIVLSVLELCVVISVTILGIKALRSNRQNKVSAPLQI
ncbi:uncharacterized protein LOC105358343 isoform X2 [Oryzias latipes]|uniref:uncharacterized protein LOC105358343 isoform X2 n=1 Tax=Oryzias latipes TaxID=8090 RepID=UPI000CE1D240|nr:uncharacterized protein LOC105358343 isoform X2 [Oryzias latipes]